MQSTIRHSSDIGTEYVRYCRRRLLEEYLPRIKRCLSELGDEDIWWRGHETDNSIGNLLLHLNGNMKQWIISGIGGKPDERVRSKEFAERTEIPREELVRKFEETVKEVADILARFDTGLLLEIRQVQKYEVTCLDAISHVVEHVAQHTGQIIYITKLRRGIDLKFYDL